MVNIAEFEYCQSATVSVGRSVQSVDSLHSSIRASDTPSNVECSGGVPVRVPRGSKFGKNPFRFCHSGGGVWTLGMVNTIPVQQSIFYKRCEY